MRINSKLFVVLLAALTLALCVSMLWLWQRLSRPAPAAVLGRIALVLSSQLAMTATILATVNIYFGFYTSWQDLLGGGAQNYRLQVHPAPAAVAADAGQIPPGDQSTIHGLRSGISADLDIDLPPGYQDSSQAHDRYPVIVVDDTGPSGRYGAALTYFQQHGTDQVPAVLAFVFNGDAPAIACTDVAASPTQQGALFWDQDLRTAIAAHFRVDRNPADWAVVGAGTNAACAGTLAVLSSGYYSAAATIGPWTGPADPPQDPPAAADNPQQWLRLYPGPPSSILLVDPDQATEAVFPADPGALRVTSRTGMTPGQVFAWLVQVLGGKGPGR
jgi:hypothetical protein